jgi:hypothetical protein
MKLLRGQQQIDDVFTRIIFSFETQTALVSGGLVFHLLRTCYKESIRDILTQWLHLTLD